LKGQGVGPDKPERPLESLELKTILMTKQLLLIGTFFLSLTTLNSQTAGALYLIDDSRRLALIDPANGEVETLSAQPVFDGEILPQCQAADLEGARFFLAYTDAAQTPRLLTLDLATGAVVSDSPLSAQPRFLKYHCLDETLYALDAGGNLWQLDPLGGQPASLGMLAFEVTDAAAAALDPYGDRLFFVDADNRLVVLDAATAEITAAFTLPAELELSSLAYNCEDDFLYGLMGDGARLVRLNVETGIPAGLSATDVAPNGYQRGDRSLNLENGTFTFAGRDAGNILRLYTLALADGAVLFQPAIDAPQPYFAFSYANRCVAEAAFTMEGGCTGESIAVENASKARTYLWDFGDPESPFNNSTAASPTHIYSAPGTYTVTLIASVCDAHDTTFQQVVIDQRPEDPFEDMIELCPNDTLVLDATIEGAMAYLWQDSTTAPTLAVDQAGRYEVTITVGACNAVFAANVIDSDCPCFTDLPNAFTPNGDGLNDFFGLLFSERCDIGEYRLRVFNRWGQEVFASTNHEEGWDGNADGQPAPSDTYFYQVQYSVRDAATEMTRNISRSGDVSLLR
jgi:gliding motility-associated-like protein